MIVLEFLRGNLLHPVKNTVEAQHISTQSGEKKIGDIWILGELHV